MRILLAIKVGVRDVAPYVRLESTNPGGGPEEAWQPSGANLDEARLTNETLARVLLFAESIRRDPDAVAEDNSDLPF
jgi:hypothetical protein